MDATSYISPVAKAAGDKLNFNKSRGSCNTMLVENRCGRKIKVKQYYTLHGRAKKLFYPTIEDGKREDASFKSYSNFATSGCSGIVTFELDDKTWLHVLWDCPYTFKCYDNFIALYLCDDPKIIPNKNLFYRMEQKTSEAEIKPEQQSTYDLVCCGPGKGTFLGSSGKVPKTTWGLKRLCEVKNSEYHVTMTMGDSHQTSSTVIIERNDSSTKE